MYILYKNMTKQTIVQHYVNDDGDKLSKRKYIWGILFFILNIFVQLYFKINCGDKTSLSYDMMQAFVLSVC